MRIILKVLKDALVVPEGAVAYGQGGSYAFVIKSDNTPLSSAPSRWGSSRMTATWSSRTASRPVNAWWLTARSFLMSGNEVIVTSKDPKKNRLPKGMTDKVIAILKKYGKGSPQLFKQIEQNRPTAA